MWAPLRGFMYGPPFANLRTGTTRPQVSSVAQLLLILLSQSRGGVGRGARGLGYYQEFSK